MQRFRFLLPAAATLAIASLHAAAQTQPLVDGEVRKVDLPQQKLTLKHGEIKALGMPPMTMTYRVKNPEWLKEVAVGDHVKFEPAKIDGIYTITKLEKQ
jgi:Cu/Ag efflux protein CusF